jgi:hypothetical protein
MTYNCVTALHSLEQHLVMHTRGFELIGGRLFKQISILKQAVYLFI